MTFRTRLIISFLLVAAIPIILLAVLVRSEMSTRLSTQYREEIDATVAAFEAELDRTDLDIRDRLSALILTMTDDNDFRLAISRSGNDRRYVLDYAESALRTAGFATLQIQDAEGRIISSGHFRNEFDRVDAGLVEQFGAIAISNAGSPLVAFQIPEGMLYAIARLDSFQVGNQSFTLIAGAHLRSLLRPNAAADGAIDLSIELPGGVEIRSQNGGITESGVSERQPSALEGTSGVIERSLSIPFIGTNRVSGNATVFVRRDLRPLNALRRRVDTWIALVVGVAGLLAGLLVLWNASRLSRPLAALARQTDSVDLDRLDVDFGSDRNDEIGALSNVLGKMTRRLRTSTVSLRDAERRATVGDLARQVNHDVKNGLTPIRNIVRHLSEMSSDNPNELGNTFVERLPALDAGIAYLDNLSTNYGRLSQPSQKTRCDVGAIVRLVAGDYNAGVKKRIGVTVDEATEVEANPVALRRIIENLITNAIESLEGGAGHVSIRLQKHQADPNRTVLRMTVSDTGVGMTEEQKSKIFENFYTTKESGTGLGLSIVRRLVMDLGGSIRVDSTPGEGTSFTVDIPIHQSGS